jgi:hypothetical protein
LVLQVLLALTYLIPGALAQGRVLSVEARLRQFPPTAVALDSAELGRRHCEWLSCAGGAVPPHRYSAYGAHIGAAHGLSKAWACLYEARRRVEVARDLVNKGGKDNRNSFNSFNSPDTVEQNLYYAEFYIEFLERSLGDDDFRAGRMPPPVPYWYIPSIN